MIKKKGFTLIELLAVIVILAIISLIAVPIVINIINDAKKESLQRSIDLYMDTVQKRITQENMKVKYDPDRCDIQPNGNVICFIDGKTMKTSTGEDELTIEMNGKKPERGTIKFKQKYTDNTSGSNKLTYNGVVLEGRVYTIGVPSKEYVPPTEANDDDYRGYYADVDGDGEVDGVIYADLNNTESGNFYNDTMNWGLNQETYSYTKETGLKEYLVSSEMYKANKGFGTRPIISLKKGSTGNARFYVMALEDFTVGSMTGNDTGRYYWYKNASTHMQPIITSISFGAGMDNTRLMIEKWKNAGTNNGYENSPQDDYDVWKHIQSEYAKGWYIPSRGEWSAFGDYFKQKSENGLTHSCLTSSCENDGNYDDFYGLSFGYWSSSQCTAGTVWYVYFKRGCMYNDYVTHRIFVRLGTTF